MPANYDHRYFLSILDNVYGGISIEGKRGLCAGMARMATSAFLCGKKEFDVFNERLNFMASNPDLLTFRSIERTKNAIASRRDAAREAIKKELKAQHKPLPKYIKVNVPLTETEKKILDSLAFLDGIELYHQSRNHQEFTEDTIMQSKIVELSKFVQSYELENLKGLFNATAIAGIYDKNNLMKYLGVLNDNAKNLDCNIALSLGSDNHEIALNYDCDTKRWCFIDANHLPPKNIEADNIEQLAIHVLLAFEFSRKATLTGFGTQVISTGKDKEQAMAFVNAVKQSPEFKEVHAITPENSARLTTRKYTLAVFASRIDDCDTLQKLVTQESPTLSEPQADGCSATSSAAMFGSLKATQILVDAKKADGKFLVDLDKPVMDGLSAAYIAVNYDQPKILQLLAEAKTADGKPRVDLNRKFIGETIAHNAAAKGDVKILKVLYENGADFSLTNREGQTVRAVAKISRQTQVLKFLDELEKQKKQEKSHIQPNSNSFMQGILENKSRAILKATAEPPDNAFIANAVKALETRITEMVSLYNEFEKGWRPKHAEHLSALLDGTKAFEKINTGENKELMKFTYLISSLETALHNEIITWNSRLFKKGSGDLVDYLNTDLEKFQNQTPDAPEKMHSHYARMLAITIDEIYNVYGPLLKVKKFESLVSKVEQPETYKFSSINEREVDKENRQPTDLTPTANNYSQSLNK